MERYRSRLVIEPNGFNNFSRDLKRTPLMLNQKPKDELGTCLSKAW